MYRVFLSISVDNLKIVEQMVNEQQFEISKEKEKHTHIQIKYEKNLYQREINDLFFSARLLRK